jgi:hypothetical protein
MTGYAKPSYQQKWFVARGYKFELDKDGNLWTTDQWLNHADKYKSADNDDGFNLGALKHAS